MQAVGAQPGFAYTIRLPSGELVSVTQPGDLVMPAGTPVLVEYGAPEKVAATYPNQNYLIGPRMYPIFELVTRIVLIVLFAVTLAGLGLGATQGVFWTIPSFVRLGGERVPVTSRLP